MAAFAAANDAVVFGFFTDMESNEAKSFLLAADRGFEILYGYSLDADVAAHYEVTVPKIIVLKKFDELRSDFTGEFTSDDIHAFASSSTMPSIIEFSDSAAPKIFGGPIKSHVILFASKSDENFEGLMTTMRAVSKLQKTKLLFLLINTAVSDHQRVVEFFGLAKDDIPAIRLINLAAEMAKYKPSFGTPWSPHSHDLVLTPS